MGQVLLTNNAYTTLAAGCAAGDTTLTVTSSSTFPAPTTASTNWFYACLQDTFANMEIVKVTNVSGTVWTVTRGVGGTTARAFVAGSVAELRVTAETLSDVSVQNSAVYTVELYTATAGQTAFPTVTTYYPAINTLDVFVNGLQVNLGTDYVETSGNLVTFTSGLTLGNKVKFKLWRTGLTGTTDAAMVTYQPAGTGAVARTVQTKLREQVSINDEGAVADWNGTAGTDNTSKITTALADYSATSRRNLKLTAGAYYVASAFTITDGAQISGEDVPRQGQPGNWIVGNALATNGSHLFTNAGVGTTTGYFIKTLVGSALKNINIWYSGQTKTDSSGSIVQYPPTILVGQGAGGGDQNADNVVIENVSALNCYEAMRIGDGTNSVGRTIVENCFFNPFYKGITITTQQGDVCMLRKVFIETQFTTDQTNRPNLNAYLNANMIAFDIGNAYGVNMTDCIALGVGYGVKVTNQTWANITNCLFDYTSVPFTAVGAYRVAVSNCDFINNIKLGGPSAVISGVISGLMFATCVFGDYYGNIKVGAYTSHSSGTVKFTDCTFTNSFPAILNTGTGLVQINGSGIGYDHVVGQNISVDGGPSLTAGTQVSLTNLNPTFPAATGWTYSGGTVSAITNGIQISGAGSYALDYRPDSVSTLNGDSLRWSNGMFVLEFDYTVTNQAGSAAMQLFIVNDSSQVACDIQQICADTGQGSGFPEGVTLHMAVPMPWTAYNAAIGTGATKLRFSFADVAGTVHQIQNVKISKMKFQPGFTGREFFKWARSNYQPGGYFDPATGLQVIEYPALPAAGTYSVGDVFLLTTAPTAGGYSGYICTTSPSTLKGFGLIQA